ncbi:MAG: patatin-like phospholipase family protein [Bdellovibrionota bacterium]
MPSIEVKNSRERTTIGPKRKVALVCSGGAAKAGAFHLGVALALQEQGFRFYGGLVPSTNTPKMPGPMEISTYVGSSAGSIICAFLAAGYSLENIFSSVLSRKSNGDEIQTNTGSRPLGRLTYQKMFKFKPVISPATLKNQFSKLTNIRQIFGNLINGDINGMSPSNWLKTTGLFSTSGIEKFLREEVLPSNKFQDYMADLFIVSTQLNHSRKVVFGKYKYKPPPHDLSCQYDDDVGISDACAASAAMPLVFSPYQIKHKSGKVMYYIDGEIRDTLSSHIAIDAGADLVIASHTHQPYHFMREIGSLTDHGLSAIMVQALYLLIEQKINNHIYNKQIQRNAIDSVSQYCKKAGLSQEHRKRICEILELELHHHMDVDTIYIHPDPNDTHMFFGEHFTLSPKKMSEYVKSGFRAAIRILGKYKFTDKPSGPVVGIAS